MLCVIDKARVIRRDQGSSSVPGLVYYIMSGFACWYHSELIALVDV